MDSPKIWSDPNSLRLLDFLQGHGDTAEEQIHPVATFSWHQIMDRMGVDWIEWEFAGIHNQQSMNSGVPYLQTGETLRLRAPKMCFGLCCWQVHIQL